VRETKYLYRMLVRKSVGKLPFVRTGCISDCMDGKWMELSQMKDLVSAMLDLQVLFPRCVEI
jgi:hypothetical protein